MEQNYNTSIVSKRLKSTLNCDRSEALYEQVIERNFQIIGDLLRKLDKIFTKHEEFELERGNHSKRLIKIEADIEAIHNEYRRQNLQIASRMDDLSLELNGMDKQLRIIYDRCNRKETFKSFKIIDNLELHSQKCVSNCQDLYLKSSAEPTQFGSALKPKLFRENSPVGQAQRQSEYSKSKHFVSLVSQDKRLKLQSPKNAKRSQDSTFQRKSKLKKQLIRRSFDEKIEKIGSPQTQSRALNPQHQEQRYPNESPQVEIDKCKSSLSQVSSIIADCENLTTQLQPVWEEKPAQKSSAPKTKSIGESLRAASLNIQTSNEGVKAFSVSDNKNQLGQAPLDLAEFQRKLKEAFRKIEQSIIKNKQLCLFIEAVQAKYQGLVKQQILTQEISKIKYEIQQLREKCFTVFTTKKESKETVFFLEKKMKQRESEGDHFSIDHYSSSIVSKCLGCNRPIQKTRDLSYLITPKEVRQKKQSMRELKKKTEEVLRSGKLKSKVN